MRRGSVAWVSLPPPRDEPDRVQAGRRPAVIVHSEATVDQVSVILVVPGTSQLRTLAFPHTVLIDPDELNGLSLPTVFLGFQVMPVAKYLVGTPCIGRLDAPDFDRLIEAVSQALGM